ncbi:MAG: ABC transporter substrate-binding protein [Thermoplasmata archaeon]
MPLNPSVSAPAPPRRSISVVWFVVALLIVGGVGIAGTAAYYAYSASGSIHGNLTLTDDLGRQVTMPYDPARIVVLGPNIMDSVYRLGLRSHVVGVDCYAPDFGGLSADYSSDQIALWNLSSSMCVQVGPTFDYEALLNDTPQLVLAATIVSVQAVEQITDTFHIPVFMLQPSTLGGIQVDVSLLGQIFGVGPAANTLSAQLGTELYNVTTAVSTITDGSNFTGFPTVLITYDVDSNGYWTFGPGTFGESLIEVAGGSSISANATLGYPELSGEQVLVANPHYLVYGTGFGLNESYYATAPFWGQLTAVQTGNTLGMDSNWLTEPDPTMILMGLPVLFEFFYPSSPS